MSPFSSVRCRCVTLAVCAAGAGSCAGISPLRIRVLGAEAARVPRSDTGEGGLSVTRLIMN